MVGAGVGVCCPRCSILTSTPGLGGGCLLADSVVPATLPHPPLLWGLETLLMRSFLLMPFRCILVAHGRDPRLHRSPSGPPGEDIPGFPTRLLPEDARPLPCQLLEEPSSESLESSLWEKSKGLSEVTLGRAWKHPLSVAAGEDGNLGPGHRPSRGSQW